MTKTPLSLTFLSSFATSKKKNLSYEIIFCFILILCSFWGFSFVLDLSSKGNQKNTILLYFALFIVVFFFLYFVFKTIAIYFNVVGPCDTEDSEADKLQFYKVFHSENEKKIENGVKMTVHYYDLVTDWYEIGWGQSFQLGGAQGFRSESFVERCRRHEYWLAHRAQISKGQNWIDLGCGVGGPMRNLARFTQAHILGVNLNQYQLKKAKKYIEHEGLEEYCSLLHCDFTKLEDKLEENSYDGAFSFEAICHAPDKKECYKSIFKILKPGGVYTCFEWVMKSKYNPNNPEHQFAKKSVEILGGICNLEPQEDILKDLKHAGFVVEKVEDFSDLKDVYPDPWYNKFDPNASILNFPISKIGIFSLQMFLRVCEFLCIVPAGSAEAHRVITSGIPGSILAGKLDIFTPHLFILARKPIE